MFLNVRLTHTYENRNMVGCNIIKYYRVVINWSYIKNIVN